MISNAQDYHSGILLLRHTKFFKSTAELCSKNVAPSLRGAPSACFLSLPL